MLTFWGAKQARLCDGLTRRDFLRVGALGMGGLTLADLLRCRSQASPPARPKSVIMVLLDGGPSHIDLYDMKPNAPVEFRGEFKPIHTNVPGVDICELLPLQAKIADKMAILRGVKFDTGPAQAHALRQLLTGFPQNAPHRPAFGSIVSKVRGLANGLPPYMSTSGQANASPHSREDAAYLGPAHNPFTGNGSGLSLSPGMTLERLNDRRSMLESFDGLKREVDANAAGLDDFTQQALALISSGKASDAFDVTKETPQTKAKYGNATSFLRARRLVEAGVSVVTLKAGSWDGHENNFRLHRQYGPELDQALYALITDLHERGLHQDVAVVVWGEFGRAPRIDRERAGRNHWADAGFALMIGGGLKMGQAIGDTGPCAERSRGIPYTPQNVLATLYHVLGIDPELTFPDHQGRPMYLLDERGRISELL